MERTISIKSRPELLDFIGSFGDGVKLYMGERGVCCCGCAGLWVEPRYEWLTGEVIKGIEDRLPLMFVDIGGDTWVNEDTDRLFIIARR